MMMVRMIAGRSLRRTVMMVLVVMPVLRMCGIVRGEIKGIWVCRIIPKERPQRTSPTQVAIMMP